MTVAGAGFNGTSLLNVTIPLASCFGSGPGGFTTVIESVGVQGLRLQTG
ncbi:MAG: hypothetical protein ACUVRY_06800 [Thermoanaerobaculaceae bacterium]